MSPFYIFSQGTSLNAYKTSDYISNYTMFSFYFYHILTHFEDYVRDNWKRVKSIYRSYNLVFNRGDSILECFNWVTKNYGLRQPVLVRYHMREELFLSLLSLTRNYNKRWGMRVRWLSQEWRIKSICLVIHFI